MFRNLLFELTIGYRFLFRKNKKLLFYFTSLSSILSIVIGTAILVVVPSVMNGFYKELESRIINMGAHIQVAKFGYEDYPVAVQKKLEKFNDIKAVSPFVVGQAISVYGRDTVVYTIEGVVPALERKTTNISHFIVSGNLDIKHQEVIIGKEIGHKYGYKVGDKITLVSPYTNNKLTVCIKGIFYSGIFDYDANIMIMDLGDAQNLFDLGHSLTGFKIKVKDPYLVATVKRQLTNSLNIKYDVNTWMDLNKSLIRALALEKRIMYIILFFFVIISGFCIYTSLAMNVMNRRKEIGILKSLGFSQISLIRIFIMQGLLLAWLGIALGILLGVFMTKNINTISTGIAFITGTGLFPKDVYYMNYIPTYISIMSLIKTIGFTLIVAFIASYYPARVASKFDPIETIKYE